MESAPKSSVSEKRKPVRRKYLKASGCAEKGAVVSFASELSEKFSRAGGGIINENNIWRRRIFPDGSRTPTLVFKSPQNISG